MLLTQHKGILSPLTWLMGVIINAMYNLFNAMGVETIALSIIVFTILVRVAMMPLNFKSTKSSKIQQFLQPEFKKIQKKYKGKKDQESMLAQQKETSELQKKYGIKMTSGCLTSFIQFPIMMSLYYVMLNLPAYIGKIKALYTPIAAAITSSDGWAAKFTEFVTTNSKSFARATEAVKYFSATATPTDACSSQATNYVIDILGKCNSSQLDSLSSIFGSGVGNAIANSSAGINRANDFILGINLSEAPGFALTWALIIPIASFVFQFLSMKVMPAAPTTGDAQQEAQMKSMKTMMYVMSLFSFFITVSVPAGLGLYWAVGGFIAFVTTVIINAYYDRADMAEIVAKAKEKAELKYKKELEKNGGKPKKSFLDKMQEAAYGQSDSQESSENSKGMNKYGGARLKNYSSSTSFKENEASTKNVKYKPGSIAEKANALKQYNEKGDNK
ncbi:MAG: YidC/Oxa1 family membrane protein insertase [Eubacterium sp.]|nr:YidC/Oxa1 family membrane protein insertase [Eubacterium sp.]